MDKIHLEEKNMKKKNGLIIGVAFMFALTGCAKDEGKSIIQDNDMENIVEQATASEESIDMETMSQDVEENYSTYKTTISDEELDITVNVDAKVDIPSTDKLSVYGVKQADISQDMLDKVRNTLAPDVTFYDGSVLNIETKETILAEIEYRKEEIASLENIYSDYSPEQIEAEKVELEYQLSKLEDKYANAPDDLSYEAYLSDNLIHTVDEKLAENPSSEYYNWQDGLTAEEDEVFYGINDGKNGEYIAIYVQNNYEKGSVIRYTKNTVGHNFVSSVFVGETASDELFKDGEESLYAEDNGIEIECTDKETLNMSIDEAKNEADTLLKELGITDFVCSDQGKYNEIPDVRHTEEIYYRPVYKFTYLRTIDNTMVSNEAGPKFADGYNGNDYYKMTWWGESIVIMINDTGIVGFYYNAPLEITETKVDKAQLKTFEEVKGTFEEMLVSIYSSDFYEYTYGDYPNNLDVSKVVLRYARISEMHNFESGYLVPVWDFEGDIYGGEAWDKGDTSESILTINAIDGTVVDHTVGY